MTVPLKNIKTKERIFWRTRKKTTGTVMINTLLNISSRTKGILHCLCKFYTACTERKGCYNLIDSSKVFRVDFLLQFCRYAFSIFWT